MAVLTLPEIETECRTVVNRIALYQSSLHDVFFSILKTGARSEEIANADLWNRFDANIWLLTTVKEGGIRRIAETLLTADFVAFLEDHPIRNFLYSKARMRSAFDQFSSYQSIWIDNKQVSTHLFRHAVMKRMFDDGNTYLQISDYFALASPDTAKGYVQSIVEGF